MKHGHQNYLLSFLSGRTTKHAQILGQENLMQFYFLGQGKGEHSANPGPAAPHP
jgi:hypothetical protein